MQPLQGKYYTETLTPCINWIKLTLSIQKKKKKTMNKQNKNKMISSWSNWHCTELQFLCLSLRSRNLFLEVSNFSAYQVQFVFVCLLVLFLFFFFWFEFFELLFSTVPPVPCDPVTGNRSLLTLDTNPNIIHWILIYYTHNSPLLVLSIRPLLIFHMKYFSLV